MLTKQKSLLEEFLLLQKCKNSALSDRKCPRKGLEAKALFVSLFYVSASLPDLIFSTFLSVETRKTLPIMSFGTDHPLPSFLDFSHLYFHTFMFPLKQFCSFTVSIFFHLWIRWLLVGSHRLAKCFCALCVSHLFSVSSNVLLQSLSLVYYGKIMEFSCATCYIRLCFMLLTTVKYKVWVEHLVFPNIIRTWLSFSLVYILKRHSPIVGFSCCTGISSRNELQCKKSPCIQKRVEKRGLPSDEVDKWTTCWLLKTGSTFSNQKRIKWISPKKQVRLKNKLKMGQSIEQNRDLFFDVAIYYRNFEMGWW